MQFARGNLSSTNFRWKRCFNSSVLCFQLKCLTYLSSSVPVRYYVCNYKLKFLKSHIFLFDPVASFCIISCYNFYTFHKIWSTYMKVIHDITLICYRFKKFTFLIEYSLSSRFKFCSQTFLLNHLKTISILRSFCL